MNKKVKQWKHRKAKAKRKLFYEQELQKQRESADGSSPFQLKASSVRSAKAQVKRLFPIGGTIHGYEAGELVYTCYVNPSYAKGECGRAAYSDRHELYWANHAIKQLPLVWSKPNYFEVILNVGDLHATRYPA